MAIWNTLGNSVTKLIDSELSKRLTAFEPEPLEKAVKEDGIGRKGLIFDPFNDQGYAGGLFKPKGSGSGFLSNIVLKIVSRRDPIVATIMQVRANQVGAFCRRQFNRFDTGFKIIPRNKEDELVPEEVLAIEEFILNTGNTLDRSKEDFLTFDQFGFMITWDMLTYGHCAIEKVRDRSGDLFAFLPIPAETIYYANKKLLDKEVIRSTIASFQEAYKKADGVPEDIDANTDMDYNFVQVINGKIVKGFSNEEMILARIYLQADIDLNGYAIGPLERVISMVTAHLQIENHQKQFFTNGVASKGLLVIQGDVTPNQLRTLQSQWTSQVTGPNSAWRTPILAGIKGVQWQPLTMTNRDMEYAAYQDHVLRTVHAGFMIDPEETGFGYLSKGTEQRSLSESSNEWKMTASRDRGLRPILTRIEAMINEDILPAWRPEWAEKYQFCFVGLDAETRTEEITRLQSEVQLHTTLDEAREQADLDPLQVGGGLILNSLLLQTLQSNMTKGMFMEKFMKIPGASARPDLQYIPDSMWFQWQTMQQQMMQQQAQAQQTMEQEAPEKPKAESKDPEKRKKDQADDEHEQAIGEHEAQQAQAQAQAQGIDMFIQANPELFKAMTDNLAKAQDELLAKTQPHLDAVDKMRDSLAKDFEKGADILIKEILEAVSEDLHEKKPKPGPKE